MQDMYVVQGEGEGHSGFAETEDKVRPEQRKAEQHWGRNKMAHVWCGRIQRGGTTFHPPPPEKGGQDQS